MSQRVTPQLRCMSWERTRDFYVAGLGFEVQWEHRFGPGMPVFAEVSRDGLSLFLTEHAEDCQVGGAAYIVVGDVNGLFQEITERGVRVDDPPESTPWGTREMSVLDPDGNRLRFSEAQDNAQQSSEDPVGASIEGNLDGGIVNGASQEALGLYGQLIEAWNRRDAVAFAALFGEDGTAVGFDGSQMHGQQEIAATLAAIFADHETAAYVAKVTAIRSLGPGVTLVRSVVGMIPPHESDLNPAANAVQSVVAVSNASESRIALLQNTPAALHGRPESVRQLTAELSEVHRRGETVAVAIS